MNIVIPPVIFYVVGAALVIGGTVRALTLGRRNPDRELNDDDPARARARRRHFTFGLIWVAMGLFLIISTIGVLKSKWGSVEGPAAAPGRSAPPPAPLPPGAGKPDQGPPTGPTISPQAAPTIRLDPAPPTTATPPAAR